MRVYASPIISTEEKTYWCWVCLCVCGGVIVYHSRLWWVRRGTSQTKFVLEQGCLRVIGFPLWGLLTYMGNIFTIFLWLLRIYFSLSLPWLNFCLLTIGSNHDPFWIGKVVYMCFSYNIFGCNIVSLKIFEYLLTRKTLDHHKKS